MCRVPMCMTAPNAPSKTRDAEAHNIDVTKAAAAQCKHPYTFTVNETWHFLAYQYPEDLNVANTFAANLVGRVGSLG